MSGGRGQWRLPPMARHAYGAEAPCSHRPLPARTRYTWLCQSLVLMLLPIRQSPQLQYMKWLLQRFAASCCCSVIPPGSLVAMSPLRSVRCRILPALALASRHRPSCRRYTGLCPLTCRDCRMPQLAAGNARQPVAAGLPYEPVTHRRQGESDSSADPPIGSSTASSSRHYLSYPRYSI